MAPDSHYRLDWPGLVYGRGQEHVSGIAKPAARRALQVLLGTIVAAAVVQALLALIGYRSLIVRSGSMSPALLTGDVIVTHLVRPSSLRVGDVVTFSDQSRDGVLVTHRVIEVSRQGRTYSFVTKGDSNTGVDEWTISEGGEVGRLTLRVPKLGFVVAAISSTATRVALIGLSLALLTMAIVRRIWS